MSKVSPTDKSMKSIMIEDTMEKVDGKNNGTLFESSSRSIRGNVIKRISSASNNYSLLELEHAINALSKIDIKIKTQKVIDETEFANIINGVFRGE